MGFCLLYTRQMRYRSLLFDWDGCLAPTLHMWLEVYKETLRSFDITEDDVTIGTKVFGKAEGPLSVGLMKEDLDDFYVRLRAGFTLHAERLVIPEKHVALVKKLQDEGYNIAVVTSSTRAHLLEKVRFFFPEIEVLVTQDDVAEIKPDAEPLLLAMRELKARPETTLMIGDSENDILAAANAGIDSLLYFPDDHDLFYDKHEFQRYNPTYVISDFNELHEVLYSEPER